ncbi:Six-hairpin glycosidase [Paramyrothecium foliicola]|nr:Six-hairpin glycosidase [Paramyrothecium foliicola]
MSFPRSPTGGLRIVPAKISNVYSDNIASGSSWETMINERKTLRINDSGDDFLHVYGHSKLPQHNLPSWVAAQTLEFQTSTGNSTPWTLSPRLIPPQRQESVHFSAFYNIKSSISASKCKDFFLGKCKRTSEGNEIRFPAHTSHAIDLEMPYHTTAFTSLQFLRPAIPGGTLRLRNAESYEDEPILVPYLRRKELRGDARKDLYGPEDIYHFVGQPASSWDSLDPGINQLNEECFAPFHFRTFRFVRLYIDVGPSDLVLKRFDVTSVLYPLKVIAKFKATSADDLAT